jgi:hypothetical protein
MSKPALRIAFLFLLAGCAPALASGGGDAVIVDRLYFGRNVAGEEVVSDSAWRVFLSDEVTPRFPGGFTSWSASGQWQGADGRIERERTFVLEVTHPAAPVSDSLLTAIMAAYKVRFRQESVLRISTPGRATFF